ncbi:hypothetical protein B0T18DRAFT_391241 [Schizothecium vesticola]|uniref:Cora-domain-containing protein n=1 Tax=Schizothecium vesticola TaxID=314040 RepID=A0AA40EWK5_9PEZI|nr:hypothetical protein B0T18DRAFT_391241 [Schizothecium vesticola]
MDWPDFERPFLGDDDLKFFKREESIFSSKLLRHSSLHGLRDQRVDSVSLTLRTTLPTTLPTAIADPEAEWQRWIESPALRSPAEGEHKGREITDQSGYHILLSARVRPEQEEPLIPSGLQYLPIEKRFFKKIVQRFKLHSVIRKALQRKKSYSTCLSSQSDTEPVELFTAVINANWKNNIAISSTHFKTSHLTLAVIYGCSELQMERVEGLLNRSPEVRAHPFLMAGIFAELQRDRVEALVWDTEAELDHMMKKDLKFHRVDVSDESRGLNWKRSRGISLFRGEIKKLEEEVRTVKAQLEKMVEHMEAVAEKEKAHIQTLQEPERASAKVMAEKTERFVDRFGEISAELDSMMGRCRFASEELTFAREVFMAELARKEAQNTSRQTRTSTVIGLVAMLYLPITAMATIFATPVFDFKNDWQDIHLNRLGPSGDGGPSGDRPMPVVSGYFWWYFLSSSLLSFVTLAFWWFETKRGEKAGGAGDDNSEGVGQNPNGQGTGSGAPVVPQGGSLSEATPPGSEKNSGGAPRWSRKPKSWFGMSPKPVLPK